MDATLNIYTKLLAFSDSTVNSNPRLRSADWDREVSGLAVSNPETNGYRIEPNSSRTIFNGERTTAIDGTTTFDIRSLSGVDPSRYRITATGGTTPDFRLGRNLTLNGCSVGFSVNPNNTVVFTIVSGPSDLANVLGGDVLFVPNANTGDSVSPVSVLNSGYWKVLAKTSPTSLVLGRTGDTFEAITESVEITNDSQVVAYNTVGIQVGDSMIVSNGFSLSTQSTFTVAAVTDSFIEFVSTGALPDETGVVPGSTGLSFYSENKKIVYAEVDQEAVVRLNGDTSDYNRVSPIEPGNPTKPGLLLKTGSVFAMTVVNKSSSTLNLFVVTVE